jgi:hypothetical protein
MVKQKSVFPVAKLPEIEKTEQMRLIEQAHSGTDIRLLIKEIYERTGSQTEVARELGIEQPTVSVWAMRLRIKFIQQPYAKIEGLEEAPALVQG